MAICLEHNVMYDEFNGGFCGSCKDYEELPYTPPEWTLIDSRFFPDVKLQWDIMKNSTKIKCQKRRTKHGK